MTSKPSFSQIPRRKLLTNQTIQWIRERIAQGKWHDELPTEAALCRELQVSRVTLRRALKHLTEEGHIIATGRGVRRKINPEFINPRSTQRGRVVRVLAPFSHWKMGAVHHAILEGLSHRLDSRKMRVEFESRPQLFSSHRPKELERLSRLPDTAGWVLFFSTEPMQRWFAEKGIPCVVAGRLFDEFDLPSAYPDNEAVARHAAGLLIARGHKRIAVLIAKRTSLGDRLGSAAFQEQARLLGADTSLIEYSGDPPGVCSAMNSALFLHPAATALFLTCPEDAVTALCHTLKAGIAVPGQIDILVGWDDPILDYTIPPLTHYKFNGTIMGKKLGTMIIHRIENRGPRTKSVKFLGELDTGGTLRSAPKR